MDLSILGNPSAVKASRFLTHIKRLRESLSTVQCASLVETVRGAGYRLSAQGLPQVA